MATALRPRPSASTITSRKGSQALRLGARAGGGGHGAPPGPADTSPVMAGFEGSESVDTPPVMAGFGGPGSVDTPVVAGLDESVRGRPRPRTATPAAFR